MAWYIYFYETDGSLLAFGHNAITVYWKQCSSNHATPQVVFDSGVQAVAGGHEPTVFS